MRLINADDILYLVAIDKDGKPFSQPLVHEEDIKLMTEVDAIPADWLYKWASKHNLDDTAIQIYQDWQKDKNDYTINDD